MSATITRAEPDSPDAAALIAELEQHLAERYPAESRHGYSVEKLIREGVAFFLIHRDAKCAGCGGVKIIGSSPGEPYGELKRMYVRPHFRGHGLGKALVEHLCTYALQHGVHFIRLETGIHQHEAIALYERMGFTRIQPFGSYRADPLSRFFEKRVG